MKTIEFKTAPEVIQEIANRVYAISKEKKYRLVTRREKLFCEEGYNVVEKPAGTGGVGTIKECNNYYYIQISYGHGWYNYAKLIQISK
jgi:hypothetical protein